MILDYDKIVTSMYHFICSQIDFMYNGGYLQYNAAKNSLCRRAYRISR